MTKKNNSLDFTEFISKDNKTTSAKSAAEKLRGKTATPPVKPQKKSAAVKPTEEPSNEPKDVETTTQEQKVLIENQPKNPKEFLDYFEKNFTSESSDLIAIDRALKNKLALLCSTNRKTSQLTLVSNIVQEWFDTHEKEVNKLFRTVFK